MGERPHDLSTKFSTLVENLEKAWFFFRIYNFIYFVVGRAGSSLLHLDFSLVGASGGYALAVMLGLLAAVASPGVEHGLSGPWASAVARGLSSCAPGALELKSCAHRPSGSAACGIFLHQGWNLCLLHWILYHWVTFKRQNCIPSSH